MATVYKIASGLIEDHALGAGQICLNGTFAWTGSHSFASGRLVLPRAGAGADGEIRFCATTNKVQVHFGGGWHNVPGDGYGDYCLGDPFCLPYSYNDVPGDGEMRWGQATNLPEYFCTNDWRPLADRCWVETCLGELCSCMDAVASDVEAACTDLIDVHGCLENLEGRIAALEALHE